MNVETIILDLPVIIKSSVNEGGERRVSVEASNEFEDKEGDVILQKALLDSSDYFIKNGHFDIDHISELGHRMGISNPERYIIGYPTTVKDLGDKRTGVEGFIFKHKEGLNDPSKNVYDAFWNSLQTDPPTRWKASIYGTANELDTSGTTAKRHIVKAITWKSLAFTKRPVNDSIKGEAKILTAKAFIDLVKSENVYPVTASNIPSNSPMNARQTMMDTYHGHICHSCPKTDEGKNLTFGAIREHFEYCECMMYAQAEIAAAALFYFISRQTH